MATEGEYAPAFALSDDSGNTVRLSDLRGRRVVLFFYPRDDTPGCTTEACGFRDDYATLSGAGAIVLGISPQDVASHRTFKEKYALPFPLLVDEDHRVAEAYGVWEQKLSQGQVRWGNQRTTFVIAEDGRIARVFRKVSPAGHSREILDVLLA